MFHSKRWRIDSLDERIALAADFSHAIDSLDEGADFDPVDDLPVEQTYVDTGEVEFVTTQTLGDAATDTATLSGSVFVDSQRNLVHDSGELGLENVLVELADQGGSVVAVASTNSDGAFSFDGIAPGTYDLVIKPLADYPDGGQRVGTAGGDALHDHAIRGIGLNRGDTAADYAFTVLPRTVKPQSGNALPTPVLHGPDNRASETAQVAISLSVQSVGYASSVLLSRETDDQNAATFAASSLQDILAQAAPSTNGIAPIEAIPSSGSVAETDDDLVVVANVTEWGISEVPNLASLDSARATAVAWNDATERDADVEIKLSGDFDGDGQPEDASFRQGKWWIDRNGDHVRSTGDLVADFGPANGLPLTGDIDGDGKDEIVVIPQRMADRWLSRVRPNRKTPTRVEAIAGDWMGQGRDTIGLSTSGNWWIDLNGNRRIDQGDRFGTGSPLTEIAPSATRPANTNTEVVETPEQPSDEPEITSRSADRAFEDYNSR